jgi:hypothetical protein
MRSHSIFSIRKLWLLRNSPVAPLTRKAIAHLGAESTCCYRLRYGKSQMEFRVGIVECDRFLIEAASIGGFSPELNETRLNRKPPAPQ